MAAEYVPAELAAATQVNVEVIPFVTGPEMELQEVLGPVSVQVGTPVGATDPVVPAMVAV